MGLFVYRGLNGSKNKPRSRSFWIVYDGVKVLKRLSGRSLLCLRREASGFMLLTVLGEGDRIDLAVCMFYKFYTGRELDGGEFSQRFRIYFESGLICCLSI